MSQDGPENLLIYSVNCLCQVNEDRTKNRKTTTQSWISLTANIITLLYKSHTVTVEGSFPR